MTSVHPAYRRALADAGARVTHRGTVGAAPPGAARVEVREREVTLGLLFEQQDPRLVLDARHQGAGGLEEGLLDAFCALLVGRPLHEAVHHGVIRLEAALRDPAETPPVPGILSPRNADPIFALPLQLIRALRAIVGPLRLPPEERGKWQDRPAAAWLALSRDEQHDRVRSAFADAVRALRIEMPVPEIVDVKDGFRIVIAPREAEHRHALGRALIAIERTLQERLDARLELQFESVTDRNRRADRLITVSDHAAS